MIRIYGDIRRINLSGMTAEEADNMAAPAMNDHQRRIFQQDLEVDLLFELPNIARFRVNALTSNRDPAAVFRIIPSTVLTLEDLRTPRVFQKVADNPRGLVLVTGPIDSGKFTTLTAVINCINGIQPAHILTIEDPIEFVHPSRKALTDQRELHQHTHSFISAPRSALREDSDVILVGEVCDPKTIGLVLTTTETGYLVFDTLHIIGTAETVDRIVDIFLAGEKEMVRLALSEPLRVVISQTPLKVRDDNGHVATHEILVSAPAVRNLTRENKIVQINSTLQIDQAHDMQTFDQMLQALVHQGTISPEIARSKAQNSESPSIAQFKQIQINRSI